MLLTLFLLKPRLDCNGGFGFSTSNLSLSLSFCKQVLSISLIKTEILADSSISPERKVGGKRRWNEVGILILPSVIPEKKRKNSSTK